VCSMPASGSGHWTVILPQPVPASSSSPEADCPRRASNPRSRSGHLSVLMTHAPTRDDRPDPPGIALQGRNRWRVAHLGGCGGGSRARVMGGL
jgi:hypothetical protein